MLLSKRKISQRYNNQKTTSASNPAPLSHTSEYLNDDLLFNNENNHINSTGIIQSHNNHRRKKIKYNKNNNSNNNKRNRQKKQHQHHHQLNGYVNDVESDENDKSTILINNNSDNKVQEEFTCENKNSTSNTIAIVVMKDFNSNIITNLTVSSKEDLLDVTSDSSIEEKRFCSSLNGITGSTTNTIVDENKSLWTSSSDISNNNINNVIASSTSDLLFQQLISFLETVDSAQKPVIQNVQNGFFHYFYISKNSQENAIFIINCMYELLPLTRFVRFSRTNLHPELLLENKCDTTTDDDVMTYNERDQCLTYIKRLHEKSFLLLCDTFSTCVSIFDRFLAIAKVKRKFGLCTAIACYSLASQYHETLEDILPRGELLEHSKCGGTIESLEKMEQIVISKLHSRWPMFVETRGVPLDYLRLFMLSIGDVTSELMRLLLNVLCSDRVMNFCPACIACSVIQIGFSSYNSDNVKFLCERVAILAKYAGVREMDLQACVMAVANVKYHTDTSKLEKVPGFAWFPGGGPRSRTVGKVPKSSYIMAKYLNLDTIPELTEF